MTQLRYLQQMWLQTPLHSSDELVPARDQYVTSVWSLQLSSSRRGKVPGLYTTRSHAHLLQHAAPVKYSCTDLQMEESMHLHQSCCPAGPAPPQSLGNTPATKLSRPQNHVACRPISLVTHGCMHTLIMHAKHFSTGAWNMTGRLLHAVSSKHLVIALHCMVSHAS